MISELSSYQRRQQKEWAESIEDYYDILLHPNLQGAGIQFGPKYHVFTSHGELMNIFTLLTGSSERPTFHLIGMTAQNELTGIRETDLSALNGQIIAAQGIIYVAQRQRGYTIPLELAHMDLLQRHADNSNAAVAYVVRNDNSAKLDSLKRTAQTGNYDDELIELIEAKNAEQRRWLRVYGKDGLLDFDAYRRRLFHPHAIPTPHSLSGYGDITLQRGETGVNFNRKIHPIVISEEILEDTNKLRNERLEEYATVVFPAIKRAAGRKV